MYWNHFIHKEKFYIGINNGWNWKKWPFITVWYSKPDWSNPYESKTAWTSLSFKFFRWQLRVCFR